MEGWEGSKETDRRVSRTADMTADRQVDRYMGQQTYGLAGRTANNETGRQDINKRTGRQKNITRTE